MSKATRNIRSLAKASLNDPEMETNMSHAVFWIGHALEEIEARLIKIEGQLQAAAAQGKRTGLASFRR